MRTVAWRTLLLLIGTVACDSAILHTEIPVTPSTKSLFLVERGALEPAVRLLDLTTGEDPGPLLQRAASDYRDGALTVILDDRPVQALCMDPGPLDGAATGKERRRLPSGGAVFELAVADGTATWRPLADLPADIRDLDLLDRRKDPGVSVSSCGDGLVCDGVEICDDGNTDDRDRCGNDCKLSCGVVASISTGNMVTFAHLRDGGLVGFGSDRNGLGVGDGASSPDPIRIGTSKAWAEIYPGAVHTVALQTDGTLWTWGDSFAGELGRAATSTAGRRPGRVGNRTDWVQVAAGSHSSFARDQTGRVWGFGENANGQLGVGDTMPRFEPVQIPRDGWLEIIGGNAHTLAIDSERRLWAWGFNPCGQTGQPASAGDILDPQLVPGIGPVRAASGGFHHSLAIDTTGRLFAWGCNVYGELGTGGHDDGALVPNDVPTQVGVATDWVQVSAGDYHSAGIRGGGTLWTWGNSPNGQLGHGTIDDRRTTPSQVEGPKTWAQADASWRHTAALSTDGGLYTFGGWPGIEYIIGPRGSAESALEPVQVTIDGCD